MKEPDLGWQVLEVTLRFLPLCASAVAWSAQNKPFLARLSRKASALREN